MPALIDTPWAKLVRGEGDAIEAALPLIDHCLDVGAAMMAILTAGAWSQALEAAADRPLTELDIVRLVALAALHDVGKANAGFQARVDPHAPRVGHTGQVAALLYHSRLKESDAARTLAAVIRVWGAPSHMAALMAHHGRPPDEFRNADLRGVPAWLPHVNHWMPQGSYDPAAEALRVIAAVRARWPLAWTDGPKLPAEPRFVALFAGLVTLADWIGSDTRRFPVEGPHGAEREPMRQDAATGAVTARGLTPLGTPGADFVASFAFPPRGIQRDAAADDLGPLALIEAETGSGKTEAALWRWLALRQRGEVDGLYFALPTRSAAVQLHGRVQAMLDRVWGRGVIEAVLAVPGYLQAGDAPGQALPGFEVRWDDLQFGDDRRWAAERTNRYLAARVAVGTIDQALLGALRVKHAHFRAAVLSRSLLVVDEVHASDAYMTGVLEQLLANHRAAGGHALLLSATLGGTTRARLLGGPPPTLAQAVAAPYPALSGAHATTRPATPDGRAGKQVGVEVAPIIDDPAAIAERAVEAARGGASVLVIRNTVAGAVAVAEAVAALDPTLAFQVGEVATLHHGRFAPGDRRLLDAAVEAAFGKERTATGRVLVGTQTLEQSLDIDADLLLTDLAPMDVLLQRIGRLHRHPRTDRGAFADARVIVLRPADRDLTALLGGKPFHGLGPRRDGSGTYPNLVGAEATLRLLEAHPAIAIPADNRFLVEHALHPEVTDAIAGGLGTAWRNHAASCAGIASAERNMAEGLSLDTAAPFRDLTFPGKDEKITTRLGEQALLVDFEHAFAGPFGQAIDRIAIPHWMVRTDGGEASPELLGRDDAGQRFRLGGQSYNYGRWGLALLTG